MQFYRDVRPLVAAIAMACGSSALACTQFPQAPYDEATYYAPVTDLEAGALRQTLNQIIRGHWAYSYTPCMWVIVGAADADPTDPGYVIGYYTRRPIRVTDRDSGGNTPDFWNREHVWPKSHGFPSSSTYAYRDAHNLRAADKSVNADRSDDDFATGGTPDAECSGCREVSGVSWEPPDEVKGDTARTMFYMDVRYEGGDNSGVGNLVLVDSLTSSGSNQAGKLCDLVQWHMDDPVSQAEMERNDWVYSWQGNRNPFVDHPEYAAHLYYEQCGFEIPPPEVTVAAVRVPMPFWAVVVAILLGGGAVYAGRRGRRSQA